MNTHSLIIYSGDLDIPSEINSLYYYGGDEITIRSLFLKLGIPISGVLFFRKSEAPEWDILSDFQVNFTIETRINMSASNADTHDPIVNMSHYSSSTDNVSLIQRNLSLNYNSCYNVLFSYIRMTNPELPEKLIELFNSGDKTNELMALRMIEGHLAIKNKVELNEE